MKQKLKKNLVRSYLKTAILSIVTTLIVTIIVYTTIGKRPTEPEDSGADFIVLIIHQAAFCLFLLGFFTLNTRSIEKNSWLITVLIFLPSFPMVLSIVFVGLDYMIREVLTRASFLMIINSIISVTILIWNFIQMKKALKENNNQELLDS